MDNRLAAPVRRALTLAAALLVASAAASAPAAAQPPMAIAVAPGPAAGPVAPAATLEPAVDDAVDPCVGNVEPADAASVSFKIGGRIARFPRENGEPVAAGEVIAVLDTTEIDCGVAQAEAARELARVGADYARTEFERARTMLAERVLPQNKFDAAENGLKLATAQLAVAEANLRLARTNLANSVLVAPFAATLVDKSAEASEFVSPGKPVCRLIDLSSVKVRFRVPEVRAAKLKIGETVIVTVPSLARTFTGLVIEIVPSVDTANRTFPVTVKVNNPDGALMAGMFVTGRLGASVSGLAPAPGRLGN